MCEVEGHTGLEQWEKLRVRAVGKASGAQCSMFVGALS
jgi:hypothetical protein